MGTKQLVSTTINGEPSQFLCEARQSLLEVLRDETGLTGCKEGCNNGNCGACTVMLDGQPVNSCLVLGMEVDGKEIQTVEGIAQEGELHAVQQCFLEGAALQCGICTPGFIVTAKALLDENPNNIHRHSIVLPAKHWQAKMDAFIEDFNENCRQVKIPLPSELPDHNLLHNHDPNH